MDLNKSVSMIVMSCDGYSDLWDVFFDIKEAYWPECPYHWYVITENVDYNRKDVSTILCGEKTNWTGRLKKALNEIPTPYVGFFLEDYLFEGKIDDALIRDVVNWIESNSIDYYVVCDQFSSLQSIKNKEYLRPNVFKIPPKTPYGISTTPAIWKVDYFKKIIGDCDVSAWQFEMDRCKEAAEIGLFGQIVCDERNPLQTSRVPVVTQGKFTPESIHKYKKRGFDINRNNRAVMSKWDYFVFNMKLRMSHARFGKTIMKWFASNFLDIKFFSK